MAGASSAIPVPDLITQVAQPVENGVELVPISEGAPSGVNHDGAYDGSYSGINSVGADHRQANADVQTGRVAQQYERISWRQRLSKIFCFCVGKRGVGVGRAAISNEMGPVDGMMGQRLIPRALQGPDGSMVREYLLGSLLEEDRGKKTLVLDLDETLVHSSFVPMADPDYVIPVEIDGRVHKVYVSKRPHVDEFLERVGEKFEVVVFTASLAKYADPVLNLLDLHKVVRARLFRSACVNHVGNYVKDLSCLGRNLKDVIIIDNSPASYIFHPENAIPVGSWFSDPNDTELLDLIPFLEAMTKVDDVCTVLDDSA